MSVATTRVYDPRLLPSLRLADALTYISAPTGTGRIDCDPERVDELSEAEAKEILARVMRVARHTLTSTDEMSVEQARDTLHLVLVADEPVGSGPSPVPDLMHAYGHTVRTVPCDDIPDAERALWARLVLDETLEFVDAMGCVITTTGHDLVEKTSTEVDLAPDRGVNLVEAADALADIDVVTQGAALMLGIPLAEAAAIVHATNMAKMGPDGKPLRRADGKIVKPEGWEPPTEALAALLREHGWTG